MEDSSNHKVAEDARREALAALSTGGAKAHDRVPFDQLIAEYNEDAGMDTEGYHVYAGAPYTPEFW